MTWESTALDVLVEGVLGEAAAQRARLTPEALGFVEAAEERFGVEFRDAVDVYAREVAAGVPVEVALLGWVREFDAALDQMQGTFDIARALSDQGG